MTKVTNIQYKKVFKRLVKTVLLFIISILGILGTVVTALQFPAAQTYVVQKATEYISGVLHYPITVEAVAISWFDKLHLNGVSVLDRDKNQMIYLDHASVDFSIGPIKNPELLIEEIVLENGKVNLFKFASDSSVNITNFIETIRELTTPKTPRSGPPRPFAIEKVTLHNMYFSYFDQRRELITSGFDHNHFIFENINATVTDLNVIADTFRIQIDHLNALEQQTALQVQNTSLLFTVTKHAMLFENIDAYIGNSYLNRELVFEYEHINDLSDFNEKINVRARLDSSKIYTKDLGNFAPQLKPYSDYAFLAGKFKGRVVNFSVTDLVLGFGKNSIIKGKASFKGLPELNETYIDCKFVNSTILSTDLKQYATAQSYPVFSRLGYIKGTGEFVGFSYDFVAHGDFSTALGNLESDINFKFLEGKNLDALYKGNLKTNNFHIGKFLGIPDRLGHIDMNGTLEGKGLTLSEAEVRLDASISSLSFNKYRYQGIIVDATLSDELFDGFISVTDPNLKFSANGLINLKDNVNKFNIAASFEKANLKPLNFADRETYLISSFKLDFTGLKPDEIVGEAYCANTYLLYEGNKELFIDTLFAKSTKDAGIRTFYLNSDLLAVDARGNFEFTTLYTDLLRLYKEYELNIVNNKNAINSYYTSKASFKDAEKYAVDFTINIKDLNNLFSIYVPGLYLSENTKIKGEFINNYTSVFNCFTNIDTIYYRENELYGTSFELNTSKFHDSSDVLAMVYVKSPKQSLKSFPQTEQFVLEGIWNSDRLNFTTGIRQTGNENAIYLNGLLSLQEDGKQIVSLNNSSVSLLNKKWSIGNQNEILFTPKGVLFDGFTVHNANQSIELNGNVSSDASQEATLAISDFELSTLNPLIEGAAISGIVNGNLLLKDVINDLNLNGNITIDTFKVDDFLIGNINGMAGWNSKYDRLEVQVDVLREDEKIIYLDGYVKQDKEEKTQLLNLNARLNKANLEILNPILEGAISQIKGVATGNLQIQGTTHNLIVKGKAEVNNGSFKVDYLNTTYYLDDYIHLDENLIGFKKLKLKDAYGDIAVVDGGIFHDNFRNFVLNIRGHMDSFHVLNTTEKDNELFYGSAFVTGDIELLGAFQDFEIKANAVSNKGTKIYIPIQESASIEQQSFIKFTSLRSGQQVAGTQDQVDLSGIKMDFNFEITPDAYAEIIFDKRAGDIIRGNGSGNLKLEIDTRGDFFLYGSYFIQKGGYNFTLANLINKEFTIQPGSSISWYGDPYQGVLDIKAVYHQSASLRPLITSVEDSSKIDSEGSRRTPVDVLLGLRGNLLTPDIDLGIKILNYPLSLEQYVTGFESMIAQNEQELNRQVFSLLILGGFAPQYSFTGLAPDPANNLSELLTNQLGNWLSQVDENLQIDLDLNGLDRDALNTFNLRLSYTLLDGRLRITRDGRFTNTETQSSTSSSGSSATGHNNISNIAGEWTIEYLISPDGKLRLKLFNKNTQNQIGGITNTSAGFSLLHTASFNNIEDLFKRKTFVEKSPPANNSPTDSTRRQPDSIAIPVKNENH